MPFLGDLVLILGSAVFVIALSTRFNLPGIAGFLLTGMLIGPGGLAWIDSTENVEAIAELGVIFLLFIVGLEITKERLKSLARHLLVGGSLQAALTFAASMIVFTLLDFHWRESLLLSAVWTLSSTAIVLSLYFARKEINTPYGRSVTGILLFQDFLIVPLMILLPMIAGTGEVGLDDAFFRILLGTAVLLGILLVGRYVLPFFLKILVFTKVTELIVLGSLFACLGCAMLTHHLGLSMALGSFLAGMLIAETDYRYQVFAELKPFRDLFQSLFFVSIGMLLHFGVIRDFPLTIALFCFGGILLKACMAFLAVRALKMTTGASIIAALSIAQMGEFGFVLLNEGLNLKLIDKQNYQIILASAIFTMVLTPLLIYIGHWWNRTHPLTGKTHKNEISEEEKSLTIILGFGLTGKNLAKVLRNANLNYKIIDMDGWVVRKAMEAGEPAIYGDGTRSEILEAAGIHQANTLVITSTDSRSVRQGSKIVKQMNPDIHLIVCTRESDSIDEILNLGADDIIVEELESSIELVTRILHRQHLPMNIIRTQARLLRGHQYSMMRANEASQKQQSEIMELLSVGTVDSFLLSKENPWINLTINDLGLNRLGASNIAAVIRKEITHPNPQGEWVFETGDILILLGSHAQMEKAWKILESRDEDLEDEI
jgi:CPA2 family monovalent cation:H+ antiporter-2